MNLFSWVIWCMSLFPHLIYFYIKAILQKTMMISKGFSKFRDSANRTIEGSARVYSSAKKSSNKTLKSP